MTTAPARTTPAAPVPLQAVPPAPARDAEPPSAPPPALPVDLGALADDVLARLAAAAPREIERRKNKRESEFLETVRVQAQALGLTPARLHAALAGKSAARRGGGANADGRSRVKPKLWNPKDHAQCWSRRGAPPKWFQDHFAAGGTEEECLIPEGAI